MTTLQTLEARAKRVMDIVGAATAGMLLAPVLVWIALGILVTDGLPILFHQERPGLGGKPFTILKFRTMRPTRKGEVFYLTDNERITRLGRFLRATSLDELPELWNVLSGDMSLVGPRPLLMQYLREYTPEERRRHDMPPGMTGWAAVNGRNLLRHKDRIALDVWYVDHWSLALDLRILRMTAMQVLRREGVTTTEDLTLGLPLPGVDSDPRPAPVAPTSRRRASRRQATELTEVVDSSCLLDDRQAPLADHVPQTCIGHCTDPNRPPYRGAPDAALPLARP